MIYLNSVPYSIYCETLIQASNTALFPWLKSQLNVKSVTQISSKDLKTSNPINQGLRPNNFLSLPLNPHVIFKLSWRTGTLFVHSFPNRSDSYPAAKKRIWKAVSIHYVDQIIQDIVEHSMELLASEGRALDPW